MADIEYKLALVEEMAAVMKQKFLEHEPRPNWLKDGITTERLLGWLIEEVVELVTAPKDQLMREAADVANLAAVYADVKRRQP